MHRLPAEEQPLPAGKRLLPAEKQPLPAEKRLLPAEEQPLPAGKRLLLAETQIIRFKPAEKTRTLLPIILQK